MYSLPQHFEHKKDLKNFLTFLILTEAPLLQDRLEIKKYVLDSSTDIYKQNMVTLYLTWVVDNRPCLCFLLLSWLATIFDSPFPFCPRT